MKHLILTALAGAAVASAAAAPGVVHVKGNMTGLTDTMLVMQGRNVTDTVLVNDNKFEFDFKADKPDMVMLVSPGALRRENRTYLYLFAMPGERCELTGDVAKHQFGGSQFYQELNQANEAVAAASAPIDALEAEFDAKLQAGGDRTALIAEFQSRYEPLDKQRKSDVMQYIAANAGKEGTAVLVGQFFETSADMTAAAALLAPEVQNGRVAEFYKGVIAETLAQEEKEAAAARKQASGVAAPDFTLTDINGKPLSLSSLRGKYVLLDFWGSWCVWCIRGVPKMKEYYAKYAGKFEILGIDCRDTQEQWKAAVAKHELPWLHVYNPAESSVLSDYGIQGFPTKVLVGPDGNIVKTFVGEVPEFYPFLDETFGGK